jgi:flagellin-specific chaperone FliS
MTIEIVIRYRESRFDGEASIDWLRPGWRALRFYGCQAKQAIAIGDMPAKAEMLSCADRLLTIMTGILDQGSDNVLGQSLARIYCALRLALLDANMENTIDPLDDFDRALRFLDSALLKVTEPIS